MRARLLLTRGGKMMYRKAPPQPPKLLLRIVSAAGAGVLVGAAACGGVADSQIYGSVVQTPDDSGHGVGSSGSSGDAGGDESYHGELGSSGAPGCDGFCGVSPAPDDASEMDVVGIDAGILISPDGGDAGVSDATDKDAPIADADVDVTNGCHVLGICIRPDASHVCLGVCIAPDQ
jgi:hypothetical protein